MVKKKSYRIGLWYCHVLLMFMGSLDAHPGNLTSFNEMVQLLKPAKSMMSKITDKQTLANVFASTSPVVLQVGFSSGIYAKKLLQVCASLATTMRHIRFFALADELTVPFLQYVGSKVKLDKVELPCLIMIRNGKLVFPLIAGFLQKSQLRSLLIERFGVQPAAGVLAQVPQ